MPPIQQTKILVLNTAQLHAVLCNLVTEGVALLSCCMTTLAKIRQPASTKNPAAYLIHEICKLGSKVSSFSCSRKEGQGKQLAPGGNGQQLLEEQNSSPQHQSLQTRLRELSKLMLLLVTWAAFLSLQILKDRYPPCSKEYFLL